MLFFLAKAINPIHFMFGDKKNACARKVSWHKKGSANFVACRLDANLRIYFPEGPPGGGVLYFDKSIKF